MALDPGVQSGVTEKVVNQLTTKTVGPPLESTGLTGDKIPDTILQISDFDRAKNQINIELDNLEALERLNQIGMISNRLSQSGPLPESGVIKVVSINSNSIFTIFQPPVGQVYVLCGAEIQETAGTNTKAGILSLYDGSDTVRLIYEATGGETEFEPVPHQIYIDNNMYLAYDASSGFGAGETADVKCGFIRVR